ncbi:MAG: ABC transporter permease [Fuerstiella sp.]
MFRLMHNLLNAFGAKSAWFCQPDTIIIQLNQTKPPVTQFRLLFPMFAPIAFLAAALAVWQWLVLQLDIDHVILPSPSEVGSALVSLKSELLQAAVRTAGAAALGLGGSTLLGLATAFLFSQSTRIRQTFYPYAILLQTVPIIAVAPMVVIGFGRGLPSVALIAGILSLFPIITSTTTGLLQVDRHLLELFHLHAATRWQTFWKLRLPNALPYLISGLRIAGGAAIVGAIVGEFFVGSSQPGLGAMIQKKSSGINTDELYATVVVSTLLGVAMFALITLAGEVLLKQLFGMSLGGALTDVDHQADTEADHS